MTVQTINGHAFPAGLDELIPPARDIAIELDRVPSVAVLKERLNIGYDKAKPLQDHLFELERRHAARVAERTVPADPDLVEPAPTFEPVPAKEPQATAVAQVPSPTVSKPSIWPIVVLALPAFVAIWSGWVGLGGLTGFGPVRLLPGIADNFSINSAITLPVGMETYAAYALRVWLGTGLPATARRFAKWSSIGSLALGALGQVAYHLMVAAGYRSAPWPITILVSCLPVAVLGMGAALAHLVRRTEGAS